MNAGSVCSILAQVKRWGQGGRRVNQIRCNSGINGKDSLRIRLTWLEGVREMLIRVLLCAASAFGVFFVDGHQAAAANPSFDCGKARFPDEIAICRTPELAEFDNVIAAAYAFLKSTRGRAYADQVGIPFWPLRQACQYDPGCIRQVQIQAINAYQAAGAPISVPQRRTMGAFEATTSQSDSSAELRLCRNPTAAADKIAHCSNVVADFNNVSALVVAHNTRGRPSVCQAAIRVALISLRRCVMSVKTSLAR